MANKLSALWIFAALNYLYCDVVALMDPQLLPQFLAGEVEGMRITPAFLLGASILVEIPIAMTVVSRLARHAVSRWANVVAAAIMTLVQTATLFTGSTAGYYVFFSAIEITTTVVIGWLAWTWRTPQAGAVPAAQV